MQTDKCGNNRTYRNNIQLGMSNSAFPLPSTWNSGSIKIDYTESYCSLISQSIHNLAMKSIVRRVDVINYDNIKKIQEKNDLESNDTSAQLIDAFKNKIS